jgi:hypothetical protein
MKSLLTITALLIASMGIAAPAWAAKKLNDGGTYIHVKNSTNKTLAFDLFVECANEGTGKFDKQLTLEPGQTAIWKLSAGHKVATLTKSGKSFYRVGLVGKDMETGKNYQWGLVGSDGMFGKEKPSETETESYRNIVVQPIGSL